MNFHLGLLTYFNTSKSFHLASRQPIKPGFHVSQFIGELLSVVTQKENDFKKAKDLSITDH